MLGHQVVQATLQAVFHRAVGQLVHFGLAATCRFLRLSQCIQHGLMLGRVDQAVLLSAADLSPAEFDRPARFLNRGQGGSGVAGSWVSGVPLLSASLIAGMLGSTKLFRRPGLSFTELLASLSTSGLGSDFVGLRLSQCIQHGLMLGRVDQAVLLSVADLSLQSLIGLLGFLNRAKAAAALLWSWVSGVPLLSASLIAGDAWVYQVVQATLQAVFH